MLATLVGLPLLLAGAAGLVWAYAPDAPFADTLRNGAFRTMKYGDWLKQRNTNGAHPVA